MSLITFRSGHTYPESNIDRIEPSITVTRKTSLVVSTPNEVVVGGDAVQTLLVTDLVIDVDHVLYPKSSKKDAEPIVVSRNPGVISKTLNGQPLLSVPAIKENAELLAEVVKHLRKLNSYYGALGALQSPIPADNALISEVATGTSVARLEGNIESRTRKLEALLESAEVTGQVVSDPMTDVYAFLDACAEKGYDISRDDVMNVLLQPPVDNIIAGGGALAHAAE